MFLNHTMTIHKQSSLELSYFKRNCLTILFSFQPLEIETTKGNYPLD